MSLRYRGEKEDKSHIEPEPEEEEEEEEKPKQWNKIAIVSILTLLSFFTRLYNISNGDFVVWDEAHFGKFGSYYLRRTFYFDVHPPLGKMLVGLAGLLSGYNGSFEFESGAKYPEGLNYGLYRSYLALFGAVAVPLVYKTALELRFSRPAAVFAGVLALVEQWWLYLFLTGVSIGCVASVKWVGFFTMALVGIYTIEDLWDLFGTEKIVDFIKHFIARAVCLILVPVSLYIFFFQVHFLILAYSGPGDAQMTSMFQARLHGNNLLNNPLYVAYGSKVSIKNQAYGGGLLHSHVQTFPHGSEQQQVTCYHHKDDNNYFIIKKEAGVEIETEESPDYLLNGQMLRLFHQSTGKNIHSHTIKAPITKKYFEVSGYGNDTLYDPNDYWVIEFVDQSEDKLKSLITTFRLRHQVIGCYLHSHNVNLPEWGFKQLEVTCNMNPDSPGTKWNIEEHYNEKLPPGEPGNYNSNFFFDFWHLNVGMMTSNNALVPDPEKEDILASSPSDWPFLLKGVRLCGWGDTETKFYLLGNPFVWWGGTISLILLCVILFVHILLRKRKLATWPSTSWDTFLVQFKVITIGWSLHYLPFCLMGRVTYLHHYFPALFFSMLAFGFLVDHLVMSRCHVVVQWIVCAVLCSVAIGVGVWFAPFAYGMEGPASAYGDRVLLQSWNLIE